MDKIFIQNLHTHGILGVYEGERNAPREILVHATLFVDTRPAAEEDSVEKSVDYAAAAEMLRAAVRESSFRTVEALAAYLAERCLNMPRVQKVRIRVEKPGAVPFADSVGVEIERP
jgi:dihydroneopterin aldolase